MNRFGKTAVVLVLFAAAFVTSLRAETAVVAGAPEHAAVATPEPGAHAASAELVPSAAPTLFNIGPLPVTNSMLYTWVVGLVIFTVIKIGTRRMQEVPSGTQNFIEALVAGLEDLCLGVLEPKVARWVFPLSATFFIFIVTSNVMGLLPGVGSIGWGEPDKSSSLPWAIGHAEPTLFRPPTADANMTVAMAAIFLVMCLYWAVRYNGFWGLIKHTFGVKVDTNKYAYLPLFLLFIFIGLVEVISILFIRPVALALRLFGNILGGESVLTLMLSKKPMIVAVFAATPFYFLELFVALVQALVFALLAIAFVGTMCTHADEEHGH